MILVIEAIVAAALWLFTAIGARVIARRFPLVGQRVFVAPDCAIHVVEREPLGEERGAVLLVHGASGNFGDLDLALSARLIALGFRVFAVDRPGHGWSDRLKANAASPIAQAKALRAALAARGVKQAIVVVHSLAGALGLAMALEEPDFVRGLALLSPVSHPWPGGVDLSYTIAASRFFGPPFRHVIVMSAGLALMRRGVRSVFAPKPVPPNYIVATRTPLVLRPLHFRANAEDVVAMKGHVTALSPRYGEIRAPTTIVTGDHDGVVYAHIHSLGCERDIPGATLHVLPGIGHSPHHSAPERVVAAILEVEGRALSAERRQPDAAPTPA
jgi:pimeloyl-ACP methyl ester carboxylesterase